MDLSHISMTSASNHSSNKDSTRHTTMLASSSSLPGIVVPSPPPRIVPSSENPASSRLTDAGPSQMHFSVPGPVMTNEQMETLRRQISVYATICQQLVELHKATVAQQNAMAGSRYGQSSLDPSFHGMGQKFTSRQRWTPSQTQLQILERLFQQGNGTPSKQRIKEISLELSQYGQISETNVYNWFQNRRARTKRRQQTGATNNGESEFDTDVDSQDEKRTRLDRDVSHDSLGTGQFETDSHNWESNTEHKPSENMSKGSQSSQRLPAVEDITTPFSKSDADGHASASLNFIPWEIAAAAHEGKPEHIAASTLQGCQTIVTINREPVQNYKTFNVPE